MPAKTKSQRRLMGMALAYKRGELKSASDEVKKLASSMSEKDLEDFASTSEDNLPEEELKEYYKKLLNKTKKIINLLERKINGNFKNL